MILCTLSNTFALIYITVYILSSFSIIYILINRDLSSNSILPHINSLAPIDKMIFSALLFNLGGIPPLLGFFPKLIRIYILSSLNILILPLLIILGSLLGLFYYLSILFNITISPTIIYSNKFTFNNYNTIFVTLITITPFPLLII